MKNRILSALLALCMTLSALPALAETADSFRPITLAEYVELYTHAMFLYIDPAYPDKAAWYLTQQEDGSIVMSDGVSIGGEFVVTLTADGPWVASICVSYPGDPSDPNAFDRFRSWSVLAAAPLLTRDGVNFHDALTLIDRDFTDHVNASTALDAPAVAGMTARISTDGGRLRVCYTLPGTSADLPIPAGGDLTGVSAQGYMHALDEYALSALQQRLVWTEPEEWLGCTLLAVDNLGDIPVMMVIDDRIALLSIVMPAYPGRPQETHYTALAFLQLTLVPLLVAGGMTEAEAVAAFERWESEGHIRALMTSAMCGNRCSTTFYGFQVDLEYTGESFNIHFETPLTGQIDLTEVLPE